METLLFLLFKKATVETRKLGEEHKMKAIRACLQCSLDRNIHNFSSDKSVRIPDDGVIEIKCEYGHHTVIIIQQEKFEILSQMAIRAIVDGYYRDAIASFSGSLERLYEFFVRTICRKHRIYDSHFATSWKEMSNQSERQLGAFIALHLLETGQPPKLLSHKNTNFRNSIIHKGTFPSRDKTVQFGQAVLDCALPLVKLLKSEAYLPTVNALGMDSICARAKPAHDRGLRTTTQCIYTLLSLSFARNQSSIEEAIAEAEEQKEREKLESEWLRRACQERG
ncbi:hypothetical protein AtDm6_1455 [Acetobacter tropicalis]|uniref:Uncharacterized protein n=1 Tax=Acetobacter tropicalis TaxID=104102 RepID=A0A094YTU2_9PROT|nr:hypothetical protein AtDm6_1455 [Acetobacter tropicalis]